MPDGRRSPLRLLVVGILVVAGVFAVVAASSWMTWREGVEPRILIRGAAGATLEKVVDAVRAFADAGLRLPPTEISVHPPELCPIRGHASGQAHVGRPRHRVVVCSTEPRIVVHELAHAWTFEHMGPRQRQAFALMRELPTWDERTHAWEDRAMEHAAEILTWAILGLRPDEVLVSPRDPESLRLAHEFILGMTANAHSRTPLAYRTPVRLNPDPCRALSGIDARVVNRFVREEAPSVEAVTDVCWVPMASGTVQPVAVIDVPPEG